MQDFKETNSQSIIDMSLTELAFIFFFILLIISTWKISDLVSNLEKKEKVEIQISKIQSSLRDVHEKLYPNEPFDEDAAFEELLTISENIKELNELTEKNSKLETENKTLESRLIEKEKALTTFNNIKEKYGEDIIEKVEELKEIQQLIEGFKKQEESITPEELSKEVSELISKTYDLKNQLTYLKKKLGNGLDHPPCWVSEQGNPQYVFNIVIEEDKMAVHGGWPAEREKEAIANQNITSIIGEYNSRTNFLKMSKALYDESKNSKPECRHLVRIYDEAKSKKAYKYYLLSVENYFYKYLTGRKYFNVTN